jgi:hypothetical protein
MIMDADDSCVLRGACERVLLTRHGSRARQEMLNTSQGGI